MCWCVPERTNQFSVDVPWGRAWTNQAHGSTTAAKKARVPRNSSTTTTTNYCCCTFLSWATSVSTPRRSRISSKKSSHSTRPSFPASASWQTQKRPRQAQEGSGGRRQSKQIKTRTLNRNNVFSIRVTECQRHFLGGLLLHSRCRLSSIV